jgi:hypothetical protein
MRTAFADAAVSGRFSITGETRLRGIAWPRSAATPSRVVWSLCPGGVQALSPPPRDCSLMLPVFGFL